MISVRKSHISTYVGNREQSRIISCDCVVNESVPLYIEETRDKQRDTTCRIKKMSERSTLNVREMCPAGFKEESMIFISGTLHRWELPDFFCDSFRKHDVHMTLGNQYRDLQGHDLLAPTKPTQSRP